MSPTGQPLHTSLISTTEPGRAGSTTPPLRVVGGAKWRTHQLTINPCSVEKGHDMDAMAALKSLPPLISIPTAGKLLGISRSAAYRYAAMGDLPTRRLGGRVYIVTSLLYELISNADNGSEAA